MTTEFIDIIPILKRLANMGDVVAAAHLRIITDDITRAGEYLETIGEKLNKVGPREFKGLANETWAIPPEAEGYRFDGGIDGA